MNYQGTKTLLLLKPALNDERVDHCVYDVLFKFHEEIAVEEKVPAVLEFIHKHMNNGSFEAKRSVVCALTYTCNNSFHSYLEAVYTFYKNIKFVSAGDVLYAIGGVCDFVAYHMQYEKRHETRKHIHGFFIEMTALISESSNVSVVTKEQIPTVVKAFAQVVLNVEDVKNVADALLEKLELTDMTRWLRAVTREDDKQFLPIFLDELCNQLFAVKKSSRQTSCASRRYTSSAKPKSRHIVTAFHFFQFEEHATLFV